MDRKKYIVEASDDVKKVMAMGVTHGGAIWTDTTDIENLEELNSDYINEHYGDLQDTAYKRGVNDGSLDVKERVDGAYQKGLDDAWEAAKKIVEMTDPPYWKVFSEYKDDLFGKITASEAIEKLKAYEEKRKADDKIEVGDEVEWDDDFTGDRFIVTRIYQPYGKKEQCDGIDDDGDVYRAVLIESLVKTGRHFGIASILEDMRND